MSSIGPGEDREQILSKKILSVVMIILIQLGTSVCTAAADASLKVNILYLQLERPDTALLSAVFQEPSTSGLQGAELAIADNNTTGRFLNQHYALESLSSPDFEPLVAKALDWRAKNEGIIVANLPGKDLMRLASQPNLAGQVIILNAGSPDDNLRQSQCTTGLLHTLPSRAMLTDALAQLLVTKRWQKWLLVKGQRPGDSAYADALKRSAKRFGADIIDEKTWSFDTDLRRVAQQEIPVFTSGGNYDVVVVADELGDVGEYIPYNTWLPRPVAGTQGLTPVAWHRVIEQWGALQLQNRFEALSGRYMNSTDYAAWLAVRTIGEAVTRLNTSDITQLYPFMLSPEFEIAAFKGRKMSFRPWNGQMRQPIELVQPRALIGQSPQEGFLHPVTDLDTLGYDQPETKCSFSTTLRKP